MKVDFFCPRWGSEHLDWDTFLQRVKADGYAGVEWFPYGEDADIELVTAKIRRYGLKFSIVMTVTGKYQSFGQYLQLLEEQLTALSQIEDVLFISAQVGREYFSAEQIGLCLDCCTAVSKAANVPVYQETHRNKWSYAAHTVAPVLLKKQEILITLDISHWFCVSESYLEDQQPAVELAMERARHIHARVGHSQGSQVADPLLPVYAEALEAHLKIWDQWITLRAAAGAETCTISPEFGPPPYLIQTNKNSTAHEAQWNLNLWMKDLLHKRYNL